MKPKCISVDSSDVRILHFAFRWNHAKLNRSCEEQDAFSVDSVVVRGMPQAH